MLEKIARGSADGCQLCLQHWDAPNPLKKKAASVPQLPRRSARSNFCNICNSTVYCNFPGDTPTSVCERVERETMSQEEFDEAREKYVNGVNGDAPRCKRPSDAMTRQKVEAEKCKSLKIVKNCGVFWEESMWNAAVSDSKSKAFKEPAAHKSETISLCVSEGVRLVGVIREETFGRPIGSYTVTEEMMKTLRSINVIADSSFEGADPAEAWSAAAKRKLVTVNTVDVGSESEPRTAKVLKVFMPTKKDGCEFSAIDELFLSESRPLKARSSGRALLLRARRAVVAQAVIAGV